MKTLITMIFCGVIANVAIAQEVKMPPTEYIFMEIHAKNGNGTTNNEKFFLGRLPVEGEAVEMVFIGFNKEGGMKFQLRVKP